MVNSLFPGIVNASPESRRKKPRISETVDGERINEESLMRWGTNRVQQIYSRKLIEALHRVRQRSNDVTKISNVAREIRETADRVLATSARGTTRWSRAILASRVRTRLKKYKKSKSTLGCKSREALEIKRIKLLAVERKLKILGRLVPGCRKLALPNRLDEATDYIAALEMQV